MQIYEYRREDGTTFEVIQSMTDPALTHDPDTGQAVSRVLHAPAVHFKGSGFYNIDYGTRKRARQMNESGEGGKSNGSSSDSAKSDSGSSSSSSKSEITSSAS